MCVQAEFHCPFSVKKFGLPEELSPVRVSLKFDPMLLSS